MLKNSLLLRNIQTLRVNNSRIIAIENAKSSGHYVYMNLNKDFQICTSTLLSKSILKSLIFVHKNSQVISISLYFPQKAG